MKNKRLTWRQVQRPAGLRGVCWSGNGTVELNYGGEHVATVSFSKCHDTWYWYGQSVNTLTTSKRFTCRDSAKIDCKNYIKNLDLIEPF